MVDPELCAAFYSMAAAEQRLKDSGYGDKFILAQEEEDIDELKMDDEIKCAPWHTSRAYVQVSFLINFMNEIFCLGNKGKMPDAAHWPS